ncbi:RNA-binding protein [Sporosalibacterium faouarense]|uniref:YlmH family RNA-binding protein n=1 Tax=Sporosalibacterium faouarense TaxID=516123 RepID=UPI00141CF7E1|nr:YlmH/Sll1252 family protein [Sporosalibacterium faouarense]MTI47755.1 RNA-binding protein [Bacillota bacterium]
MILDKSKCIEHINDEEQILPLRKVLDKLEQVIRNHTIEYTDFLDPYQRKLCYSFLNRIHDISYHEEGGYHDAERKSIILFPDYREMRDINNPISAVRVDGKFKFTDLNHRDYLGAIMALGVKREKIGDILIHQDFGQIVLHDEILDYIKYNLESIGKESVEIKEIELCDVIKGDVDYKEISSTVSSLRLDAVISSAYNMSRSSSSSYINKSRVKVNWQPIDQVSFEVNEGDMISIKGFGRMVLHRVKGTTRKGRRKLLIRILK